MPNVVSLSNLYLIAGSLRSCLSGRKSCLQVLTVNAKLAFFILHICSNSLYLFLNHLVKLREHLFNFAALDLVEVKVDVIKKVIEEVFGHITGITCCYHGDASKFPHFFVSMKVIHSHGYCEECLVHNVAKMQNLRLCVTSLQNLSQRTARCTFRSSIHIYCVIIQQSHLFH